MKSADAWRPDIEEVLESKLEEFRLLGYPKATKTALWECLCAKVWKGNSELLLHQIVADIFFLKPGTYMNYMARNAYQNDDLFASIQAIAGMDKKADTEDADEADISGGTEK